MRRPFGKLVLLQLSDQLQPLRHPEDERQAAAHGLVSRPLTQPQVWPTLIGLSGRSDLQYSSKGGRAFGWLRLGRQPGVPHQARQGYAITGLFPARLPEAPKVGDPVWRPKGEGGPGSSHVVPRQLALTNHLGSSGLEPSKVVPSHLDPGRVVT